MAIFEMQQKAVVWYSFEVEAATLEEAKQKAIAGDGENFWQIDETEEFLPIFCLADDPSEEFGDGIKQPITTNNENEGK